MNEWKDTSPEEFRRFLGLCLLMGNMGMPSIKNYWSKNPLYHHPIFEKIVSRNRFENILRCLCFYKSDDDKTFRLYKISQVLDHILENIRNLFYPGRNLSLDEALLLWRGRLIFQQYIQLAEFLYENKTHVVGTLRKTRKGNPKPVVSSMLRKGQIIFRRKKNVLVIKLKDKREVLMITTLHSAASGKYNNKRGVEKEKPLAVLDYNQQMSGIDRCDQMVSYYTTPIKAIRWLFFHLVDNG